MDVDASDAGDPRLILSSHRAIDAIGGFVPPTDLRALSVVSKTAGDSRVLIATKRVVTQRCTALAASKRARRRLEAVDAMGRFLGPGAEEFLTAIFRNDKLQTVRAAAATWLARVRFGITIALKFPPKVAATFVAYLAAFTAAYGPLILKSIFTPVFEIGVGPPPPDPGLRARRQRARDVYVTGDAAAKREAVEMLRSGRAGGTPRGEPSPQVELLEEEEAREEEALAA